MAQKYRVIDADAPVNPRVDFWKDYLPRHLGDIAPRFEQGTATGQTDFVVFEGQRTPFTRVNSQAGTKPEDQKATGKLSETRPGAWEPKARLQDMDIDGAAVNNRNLKGAKNILWSSDYPHSETTWPNSKGAIERSSAGIPAKDKDMLISGTARNLYKLG